ncbi:unnamed protein product [Brassica napus]|uniref:(rape) hypothetical protein n=1 Tax=Brassica napus TaxID=3708 RepID=A0A817AQI5_BRANA|nr:unnamed protein product [Brassica napus]
MDLRWTMVGLRLKNIWTLVLMVGFNNANDALTVVANDAPTVVANDAPTVIANDAPTVVASDAPTVIASDAPTVIANDAPIVVANDAPTVVANDAPTVQTPSPEATILGADQLATAVKAVFHMFVGENNGFLTVEESPMTTWLNLLAHEVENASGVDHEDSELVDNSLALVLAKPKTYVLSSQQDFVDSAEIGTSAPDETNPENNETSSPTNSEDYKTPPEDGPTAKSRTPEGGNVLNRHYSTKQTKIQEAEGKCIYVRSTKRGKGKLIKTWRRSMTKWMANPTLPNFPDKIMSKIIELFGEESSWYLGAFMCAGKRGYELVHEPFILKRRCVLRRSPPINKSRGRGGNQSFGAQYPYAWTINPTVGIFYVCIGEDMKASHVTVHRESC